MAIKQSNVKLLKKAGVMIAIQEVHETRKGTTKNFPQKPGQEVIRPKWRRSNFRKKEPCMSKTGDLQKDDH